MHCGSDHHWASNHSSGSTNWLYYYYFHLQTIELTLETEQSLEIWLDLYVPQYSDVKFNIDAR